MVKSLENRTLLSAVRLQDKSVSTTSPSNNDLLTFDTSLDGGNGAWVASSSSSEGYVSGPSSSVDNSIVRFDSTTGKIIQGYTSTGPTISDTGVITINNATDSTSTSTGSIICLGGVGIAKSLYPTSIYLPTSGGTSANLNYYETYSHTTTWSSKVWSVDGVNPVAVSANFTLTRIGNVVILNIPQLLQVTGSSPVADYITISTVLPARFRPSGARVITSRVCSNGVYKMGACILGSDGTMAWQSDLPYAYFGVTGGQLQGFSASAWSYTIA